MDTKTILEDDILEQINKVLVALENLRELVSNQIGSCKPDSPECIFWSEYYRRIIEWQRTLKSLGKEVSNA